MSTTALPRPRRAALDPALATVVAATLLGLLLRLAASRGEFGLDEVWSMRLVERVDGLGQVFWGISHDNNHVLNSAWLYLLGPGAPVWACRLPAVLLGTLTIPALARLCGRRDPGAGALVAVLAAAALPLVDFGSEARGYAGLALAAIVALDEAGRTGAHDRAAAWRLGAATGLGLLSHLTMAYAVAVVGLALLVRAEVHRRPGAAVREAAAILLPSALMALPAAGFVLAGIVDRGGFTIGDVDPFTAGKLVSGFGEMMLLAAGLPDALPPWLGAAGAITLLAVAARARLASPWTLALGLAALVALPLAMAALHLPNVGYARYHAVSAIVLLVLLAETLASLWGDPRSRRAAALAALSALLGALALDAAAIRDGRAGARATLALVDREGSGDRDGARILAADHPFMAGLLLGEAARRAGVPAPKVVPESDLCGSPSDWFVAVGRDDERPDGTVEAGPAACRARYLLSRAFRASPLSGTGWTLYRRG